eukprot:gnl/TRDRNA2_/TRDRNA2_151199_c0_seq1.p3 gnl/TRDRNA2_/TRDRNA2_151199_c0~~gnl/TRDRNA2_/TRDRNA2_151199_c0_seq1.p3  ORF type:complete len:153 (-),score=5.38 gnl/TRDRNA2_/TRDRNA2_151199_c0_seq1:408-866(-)
MVTCYLRSIRLFKHHRCSQSRMGGGPGSLLAPGKSRTRACRQRGAAPLLTREESLLEDSRNLLGTLVGLELIEPFPARETCGSLSTRPAEIRRGGWTAAAAACAGGAATARPGRPEPGHCGAGPPQRRDTFMNVVGAWKILCTIVRLLLLVT